MRLARKRQALLNAGADAIRANTLTPDADRARIEAQLIGELESQVAQMSRREVCTMYRNVRTTLSVPAVIAYCITGVAIVVITFLAVNIIGGNLALFYVTVA